MRVVILAGGLGTRLAEETDSRPKPMVEIGERPILWHILKYFATFEMRDFIIAAGYKSSYIKQYFLTFPVYDDDVDIELSTGEVRNSAPVRPDWRVRVIDTGLTTHTGGRLKRLRSLI